MTELIKEVVQKPVWWDDMEFCHVFENDGDKTCYCGEPTDGVDLCPSEYDYEAICESCGNPTCPRCAQLVSLKDAFDGE